MPGGLDEQPAGVLAAGLGDRSAAAALPGGMLRRHDAEIAHHLRRVPEAVKVADLGAQPGRGQVSIPRRHINRRAVCAHGDAGSARAISASSCSRRIINAATAPR